MFCNPKQRTGGEIMIARKAKVTHSRTPFCYSFITSMALIALVALFLASCADYGGMMKDIEDMMGEMDQDTFFRAVERGDVQAAKAFLDGGENVNAQDSVDRTGLQIAVGNNDVAMVRMLIEAGADLNMRDRDGGNILYYVMEGDADEVVKMLIEAGAELEARNVREETPLIAAALNGRKSLPSLIRAGADLNSIDQMGETALMKAAMVGELESLQALIEAGADVSLADPRKNTALIFAAGMRRSQMESFHVDETSVTSIVEQLLAAGADVNAGNDYGITPLIASAQERHADVATLLINAGADVNAKTTPDEFTPLMEAAKAGYADIVTLLLEAGADPALTDRVGRNAAEWASDYPDIVTMLGGTPVKKAAPAREVTPEQRERARQRLSELGYSEVTESLFVMSAHAGDLEAVKAFLDYGLSVDSKDPRDHTTTPLLGAATLDTPDIGLVLIQAGADVNAKDTNGSTALIWAAQRCGLHELVKALVEAGADVNAKAAGGATPLMMAEISNCSDNIAILQQAGAKK